ncbi:MetQ/NlpA family ABC transporter substrate-binding protein [Aminipila luticellarii]|uniref:Lipoprotein n=1 Tax=Aminipila luticellarii TaxID=2507160 RepID=A0A410PUG8_9FIRM|nr:MetQ/NlpA family ABC transporter substrate-binding protein [Aminipila luticellarii]QAT42592.1 MetQ/NlpA family ABC transporter substrate-binding protein [Aminipila luticellarii]
MKKKTVLGLILVIVLTVALSACGDKKEKNTGNGEKVVKVGVVGESNEMWDPVIKELGKEGIQVELISFTDYGTPNQALDNGEIDLNAFQHYAYLNEEIKNKGYKITAIGDTFISSMNIYSDKVSDVKEIQKDSKIAVPNDATNEGRALKILEAAGLIKLNKAAGDSPEVSDITENPLNLELVEADAANVYSLLPDVAAAVINCNYALDNGLNPAKDSIFQDNPSYYTGKSYINLIAARTADKENETYKKIVKAYQSEAVKEVYATTFKGSYIAAWKE